MNPQMFVDNITVIDFGRWSFRDGGFRGDSLNLHCRIGGALNPHEGVVIDFSNGKKKIKSSIDSHKETNGDVPVATMLAENGFDHKLILPSEPRFRDLSQSERKLFADATVSVERTSETHCLVRASNLPKLRLELPINALRSTPADVLFDLEAGDLRPMQRLISEFLGDNIEGLTFTSFLDRKPHTNSVEHALGFEYHLQKYSYTHGLRNSSSFGCQNILHGHASFVASHNEGEAIAISQYLYGAHLYDGSTWDSKRDGMAYSTDSRGHFAYDGATPNHIKLLDIGAEPTVENMASFVAQELRISTPFFLSEGLQKGCYWEP
jgi:hypothetical protein